MSQKVSGDGEEWGGFHQAGREVLTDRSVGVGLGGHSQCRN